MTMTPTNAEGLKVARRALGARTAKRIPRDDPMRPALRLLPPIGAASPAQRLAWMICTAELLERVSVGVGADPEDVALAAVARQHVEVACLEADLYEHLEAAALLDAGDDAA